MLDTRMNHFQNSSSASSYDESQPFCATGYPIAAAAYICAWLNLWWRLHVIGDSGHWWPFLFERAQWPRWRRWGTNGKIKIHLAYFFSSVIWECEEKENGICTFNCHEVCVPFLCLRPFLCIIVCVFTYDFLLMTFCNMINKDMTV